MRKFSVRWWVVDPLARYRAETNEPLERADDALGVRFRREATPEEVRAWLELEAWVRWRESLTCRVIL